MFAKIARLTLILPLLLAGASLRSHAADLPLYYATYTYGLTNGHLKAFNNAGDIAAFGSSAAVFGGNSAFILRGGTNIDLYNQPGTNQVTGLIASDMGQTNADGSVKVLGLIQQSGLYDQGIILTVNSAGQVTSSQFLPFYVE